MRWYRPLVCLFVVACGAASRPEPGALPTRATTPWVQEVLADAPLGYWSLDDGRTAGVVDTTCTAFAGETHKRLDASGFGGRELAIELWAEAPLAGPLLSWVAPDGTEQLRLSATPELGIALGAHVAATGVTLESGWHHLVVRWAAETRQLELFVDGLPRWSARPAAAVLPRGGVFVLGQLACGGDCESPGLRGKLDELVAYAVPPANERILSHVLVARGERRPTLPDRDYPVTVVVQPEPHLALRAIALPASRPTFALVGDTHTRLWDLRSNLEVRHRRGSASDIAIDPAGRLAFGVKKRRLFAWDLRTGEDAFATEAPEKSWYSSIEVTSDGRFVVVANRAEVELRRASTGALVRTVKLGAAITALALTPDDRRIVTSDVHGELHVHDLSTGKLVFDLGKTRILGVLAISPDGRFLITPGDRPPNKEWMLFDLHDGKRIAEYTETQLAEAHRATTPDGAWGIQLWRPHDLGELAALEPPPRAHLVGFGSVLGGGAAIVSFAPPDTPTIHRPRPPSDTQKSFAVVGDVRSANSLIAYADDRDLVLWDLARARHLRSIRVDGGSSPRAMKLQLTPDGQQLAAIVVTTEPILSTWDVASGRKLADARGAWLALAADGRSALRLVTTNGAMIAELVETGKQQAFAAIPLTPQQGAQLRYAMVEQLGSLVVSASRRRAVVAYGGQLEAWDLTSGNRTAIATGGFEQTVVSRDGRVGGFTREGMLRLWDLETGARLSETPVPRFSSGNRQHLALGSSSTSATRPDRAVLSDGEGVTVLRLGSGEVVARLAVEGVRGVTMLDGARVVATTMEGVVRAWRLGEPAGVNLATRGHRWMIYTDDGYFDGSPDVSTLFGAAQGARALGVDQVALTRNRPDLILERLGYKGQLADYYRRLHDRRVARGGARPTGAVAPTIPHAQLVEVGTVNARGEVTVKMAFRDAAALAGYQIYVDDVPVFPAPKPITGRYVEVDDVIRLGPGDNRVEVAAVNAQGAESLRALGRVANAAKAAGDIYFIGFGVSQYRDDAITDLSYAHQDVQDLAAYFRGIEGRTVHVHTFIDGQVTAAALAEARAVLARAGVADTLVLFVAGHGVRAADGTYYYLDHDTRLNELASTAIPFDQIESLLYDSLPRKKLFLLDTCQSGEVHDELELTATSVDATLRPRAVRGLVRVRKGTGARPNPTEIRTLRRDRLIEVDLHRRSGAIVFASSLGQEYSLEGPAFENGAFTEAILDALTSDAADTDGNASITTTELRRFVSTRVPALTGDQQHPVVDHDNIHQSFALPARVTCSRGKRRFENACVDTAMTCAQGKRFVPGAGCFEDLGAPRCALPGHCDLDAGSAPAARAIYERGCTSGTAAACNDLAHLLRIGLGVTADEARAATLFRRACDGGDPAGCYNLAGMTIAGRGVKQDAARAGGLVQTACDGGILAACSDRASDLATGRGGRKAIGEAVAVASRACHLGNATACREIGEWLESGLTKELAKDRLADPKRAFLWYTLACDSGSARGCTDLGRMYETGLGVARSARSAERFHRLGCQRGAHAGCAHLAAMLARTAAEPPDHIRELHRKACDGSDEWCAQLGDYVTTGPAEVRDPFEAIWAHARACRGGRQPSCTATPTRRELAVRGARESGVAARAAACASTPRACFEHGVDLLYGVGGPPDRARAAAALQRGCEAREGRACALWAELLLVAGDAGAEANALSAFRVACGLQDHAACVTAAMMLVEGLGTTANVARGLDALEAVCRRRKLGCEELTRLGRRIEVTANRATPEQKTAFDARNAEAANRYERACRSGYAPACDALSKLAARYQYGRAFYTRDPELAKQLRARAGKHAR